MHQTEYGDIDSRRLRARSRGETPRTAQTDLSRTRDRSTMKQLLLRASLAASTVALSLGEVINFDPVAPVLGCVDSNGTAVYAPAVPHPLPDVDTTNSDVTVLLRPMVRTPTVAGEGEGMTEMCVLWRWTLNEENKTAGNGFYFALGRSVPSVPGEVYGAF